MAFLKRYLIFSAVVIQLSSGFLFFHHGHHDLPVVKHDGFLADTHEVATARKAHLAAVATHDDHEEHSTHHEYPLDRQENLQKYNGPIALPVVKHDGFLADTHEVATARKAHLAAVARHDDHEEHSTHHEYPVDHHEDPQKYQRPIALPVVKHDGFLADTHEVATARKAHLEAVATHYNHEEHSTHQEYRVDHHEDHQKYQGPIALPVVKHDGFLGETHDVATARKAHLTAVATHDDHEGHSNHHEYPVHHYEHPQKYDGPIAVPVVLPNGYLADTPEVALSKYHHLGAVAQAKADKYYSGHQEYNYGGSYGYSGSHHGYGIPVVLPNGHIADTFEVAAAKSAHLLAVAEAKAREYYSHHDEGFGYGGAYGYSTSFLGHKTPVVLPNGYLADTHDVAAAKETHASAVAHVQAQQPSQFYHYQSEHPTLVSYLTTQVS